MIRPLCFLVVLAATTPTLLAQNAQPAAPSTDSIFKPLKWRSIGPFRGGRSNTSTGVVSNPRTYYMGTTGGGVWKTDNMGISWRNISDGFFTTGTIGAIAVAQSDPNVVYVGTGEHAIRGVMSHSGDGVYRSTDAGKTWKKIGLTDTRHISRIVVHPNNPDVVFVAAQGTLYGPSAERGIFKSTDGGVTWKKVLFVDQRTGAAELSMDATNPRIMYAAMWEHGRLPWQVISGGPGSGLYKSTDAGETWVKMSDGLPDKMGKMAIAVNPSNPEKVYALIESESEGNDRGLYVSNNAGKSWSKVSSEPQLVQRAWYYIELFVDPKNENRIYVLSAPALRSDDGGKTWSELSGVHGDYHDMWINPTAPDNFIISDDGGAVITFDGGKSFSSQTGQPTGQFYRISVDNQFPYRIYAGQQDNSSVAIASRELASGGITTDSWRPSAGGESAFLAFDPTNPRYVLGGSYQGTIEVLDTRASASTKIMAAPIQYLGRDAKDMKYRYNWNAPIIWSKHEPNVYYHGAQLLLKTSDLGQSWEAVSPDLTRNEKEKQGKPGVPYTNEAVGAENYGTLAYITESPHERGVIWTGSDDGLVHLTRDGGKTWKNVTPKGLAECLINTIEVSPFNKGTAYIATTRYKFNDHAPGLYKTTDYGATWTKIDRGIPAGAFTRVVREDEGRRDLLFAGTELGLYVSWNGGLDWAPFQLNLPVTPITDLKVHQGNLIAATSGRAFWILDDLAVLRQYKKEATALHAYQPAPAYLVNGGSALNSSDADVTGTDTFTGVNPANGVVFYYQLPEIKKSDVVTLDIADASGRLIRSFSSVKDTTFTKWDGGPPGEPTLSTTTGLNRFVWDMRNATMPGVPGVYIEASYRGHKVLPGRYRLTLKLGDRTVTAEAEVRDNPLHTTDAATLAEYDAFMTRVEGEVSRMHGAVNELHEAQEQLSAIVAGLPAGAQYDEVRRDGATLLEKLKAWDSDMVSRKSRAYDDVENFAQKFSANWLFMVNATESDLPRVNKPSRERLTELEPEWAQLRARADTLLNQDIQALNRKLFDRGIGAIRKRKASGPIG
ncbi:WD40/YVTN/BNR-like repeat-containing protein [Gemmatimonas phototrophica]|uniref:WD40/YVTN/BNR-like repeat-containing protein n=1 Tax=Gemmatimonas phototrophica TaxID=1379270 RepID=UPI00047890DE|nr:glycosyl hydrolase [Gemmatimonas phototrophica]